MLNFDRHGHFDFVLILIFVLSVPLLPSCRILLTVARFVGGICFLLCRNNINVAVVCMTIDENENSTGSSNISMESDRRVSVAQLVKPSHSKSQIFKNNLILNIN